MTEHIFLAMFAAVLEGIVGYPNWLYRSISHPVVGFGALINYADKKFNIGTPETKKRNGIIFAIALGLGVFLLGLAIDIALLKFLPEIIGIAFVIMLASSMIAQKSLYLHVRAVFSALECNDLDKARLELGKIVGRDTQNLNESDIAAAAIETLAESFCDGVVAPIFWLAIGRLGGAMAYKAVNTADSIIGHKDEKHGDFGMAAARFDDILNYIPARISGVLLCIAALGTKNDSFKIMIRDNAKHQSPNSAWSEAAMAGAIQKRLGGGATYDGEFIERPFLGDGERPQSEDISRALGIYINACLLNIGLWGLVAFIIMTGSSLWLQ